MIRSRRKRWADEAGHFYDKGEKMQLPDLIRSKGKRGVKYANTHYKGIKLSDCLDTTDERIAHRRLQQIFNEIDEGRYQSFKKTFDWCVEQYYLKVEPTIPKQSRERYRSAIRAHLLPEFKGKRISEIVTFDSKTGESLISKFFFDRKDLPESSLKKIARTLRRVIRQADSDFKLPSVKMKKGFFQTRVITESEFMQIVNFLDDRWKDLALLLGYSGLDLSEGINLTWGHIDRYSNMITRERDKDGEVRRIPIRGKLEQMIRRRFSFRQLHDDLIFNLKVQWPVQGFQRAWKEAVKKSSVKWNVRPKDLRHFYGSTMLNRGANPLEIATLMGHTSVEMIQKRYGHYSDDRLHQASSVWDSEDNWSQTGAKLKK